jgi:hypothetical protein
MKLIAVAVAILSLAACVSASAQQAQQAPPCTTPEYQQMDFWLGTWDAYYGADDPAPGGRNVITRGYGGCVTQEDFNGGPAANGLIGHSVSTYHKGMQRWRQTWVDNQGGYFALVGGPVEDDFILTTTRVTENAPYQRMVFEDITPQSFTWRWQSSADAGASWSDQWVIWYRRAE